MTHSHGDYHPATTATPEGNISLMSGETIQPPENIYAGNVFEWCWEHGPENDGDREQLLWLAWRAISNPPCLHPIMLAGTDPYTIRRLTTSGYLGIDTDDTQGVVFPAYQKAVTNS